MEVSRMEVANMEVARLEVSRMGVGLGGGRAASLRLRVVAAEGPEPPRPCEPTREARRWPQRHVEFWIGVQIAALGHSLRDLQTLQDFGLRGHPPFGPRIAAQDAFQFTAFVFARVVDQRS